MTTVGSDFISRLATLYGARIGSTSSTPGPLSSDSDAGGVPLVADRGDDGPLGAAKHVRLRARAIRLARSCVRYPASLASRRMTTIMGGSDRDSSGFGEFRVRVVRECDPCD